MAGPVRFAAADRLRGPVSGGARTWMALTTLLLVGVGLPVAVAEATGSLAIPHNDAWSHARIANTFAETGSIRLVGWNRTALVGQIVVLGPLGSSITVQNLFAALCAVVALVATWDFVRRRTADGYALLVVASLVVVPEFGLLSTSFMSDMPAFAGTMACLALLDRAEATSGPAMALGAAGAGLWAFTVREQTLVVLAIVWVRLLRDRSLSRRPAVRAACGLSMGAAVAFELWRRTLPHGDPPRLNLDVMTLAYTVPLVGFTATLYLLPLIVRSLLGPWTRTQALAAVGISTLAVLLSARLESRVFLGNYFSAAGAYGGAAPLDRQVFPDWIWQAAVLAAGLALGPAVVRVVRRPQPGEGWLWLYVTLFGLGTVAQSLTGQIVFARYLLTVLPVLAVMMFVPPRSTATVRARSLVALSVGAVLCAAAVVSWALTSNALAYDGARWRTAQAVVESGLPADEIDAGLEWVGFHSSNIARADASHGDDVPPYVTMLGATICTTVTGVERAEPALLRVGYHKYALLGRAELFAYSTPSCAR